MVYYDYANREIEELEGDNMRRDRAEMHRYCLSENAVECAASQNELPFYQAMGLGYECSCDCHVRSDEQTVWDFQRFLRETQEAGISPLPLTPEPQQEETGRT